MNVWILDIPLVFVLDAVWTAVVLWGDAPIIKPITLILLLAVPKVSATMNRCCLLCVFLTGLHVVTLAVHYTWTTDPSRLCRSIPVLASAEDLDPPRVRVVWVGMIDVISSTAGTGQERTSHNSQGTGATF